MSYQEEKEHKIKSLIKQKDRFLKAKPEDMTHLNIRVKGVASELDSYLFFLLSSSIGRLESNFDLIECLINNGGSINQRYSGSVTPFMNFVKNADLKLIEKISEIEKPDYKMFDGRGFNTVCHALISNNYTILDFLIEKTEIDINHRFILNNNTTLLHMACKLGNIESLEIILKHKPNPTLYDNENNLASELVPEYDPDVHDKKDFPDDRIEEFDKMFEMVENYRKEYKNNIKLK
jgi:hypothetical protein